MKDGPLSDARYPLLVVGLLFIVLGLVLFDDTIPRVLLVLGGALFIVEFARQSRGRAGGP